MKIKSLPILAIFFTLLFFSSCLDSNDDYEYSSNDVISYFALPDILGKQYFFTIDQLKNLIYNRDSLPFKSDTIINKILIKQIATAGFITTGDTLFNYLSDSIDLRKPLEITNWAPDGKNKRNYTIKVNVHQQDPDSLCWSKLASSFTNNKIKEEHKTIIFQNTIRTYNKTAVFYSPLNDGKKWKEKKLENLPSSFKLNTLTVLQDTLYGVTSDGEVYSTDDGVHFIKNENLSTQKIVTLIHGFNNKLFAVANKEGTLYFAIADLSKSDLWTLHNKVSKSFPLDNLSSFDYKTATKTSRIITMGKPIHSTDSITIPWLTTTGENWYEVKPDNNELACPYIENPTITYYNGEFYTFGNFENIYYSREAMTWRIKENKFLYPIEFKERKNYSMTLDENEYLWITWGNEDEVWRGRVNKLGFKK